MEDKKTTNRSFLRGLAVAFPLSIISLFFLDASLSFIFTEYWLVHPTNVLIWVTCFTILRAVFAEWVMSAVVGFSPPQSPSKRIVSIFVALVLYGIPIMTVCSPVRYRPISFFVQPLLKWTGDVIVYMPRLVATVVVLICLPILLDFSRLAPYLYIKRWMSKDEEIIPMPPKKAMLIYLLATIGLFLLVGSVFPFVPRLNHFFFGITWLRPVLPG